MTGAGGVRVAVPERRERPVDPVGAAEDGSRGRIGGVACGAVGRSRTGVVAGVATVGVAVTDRATGGTMDREPGAESGPRRGPRASTSRRSISRVGICRNRPSISRGMVTSADVRSAERAAPCASTSAAQSAHSAR